MMAPINGRQLSDGSYAVAVGELTSSTQFTFNFNGGNININVLDLVYGLVRFLASAPHGSGTRRHSARRSIRWNGYVEGALIK